MIALRKPFNETPRFTGRARAAIADGVRRGDAVAHLEYLGFSPRYMNLLENSGMNIITLEQLVERSRDDLLSIPGFGQSALNELLECLARYHELSEIMTERDGPNGWHLWDHSDE